MSQQTSTHRKQHLSFSSILLILGSLLAVYTLPRIDEQTRLVLTSKLFYVGLVLTIGSLFSYFFISRKTYVDEIIARNPIALALFMGAVFLAIAHVFSAGPTG